MERSIDITARAEAPFEVACAALADDPAGVFGGVPAPNGERFTLELGVNLAVGSSVVQEVQVDFALLNSDSGLARFGVCWRAVGHPDLFPVFGGDLELRRAGEGVEVHLAGHYRLPLGALGRFGDALLGHRLARRALEALVNDVARGLEAEAAGEADAQETVAAIATELYWG
jgi:hypothetical protein